MFRANVLIIRRSKLPYTATGIITPIGVMIPDKYTEMHGQQNVKKINDLNMLRYSLSINSKFISY